MKAVFVCPGRGTYNRTELGYVGRHFPDPALLDAFDRERAAAGQASLASLDGASRFSVAQHTRGDNASALIFAATVGDFLSLDRDSIEVVAVTGNSMGWYSALACAGALDMDDGFRIANTMGALMQRSLIGGQLVYPFVDEDWRFRPERRAELLALVEGIGATPGHRLHLSIWLGGMMVLAGDEAGLAAFEASVPRVQDRYPMRLANHAAFHTPMMKPVSDVGRERLPVEMFKGPAIPLVDGRGAIWWPGASDPDALHDYTLRTQVVATYDFTRAVRNAAREFAPDVFIISGPGSTLGGAVAQSLIADGWRGMADRGSFGERQSSTGLLASMGRQEQRLLVASSAGG